MATLANEIKEHFAGIMPERSFKNPWSIIDEPFRRRHPHFIAKRWRIYIVANKKKRYIIRNSSKALNHFKRYKIRLTLDRLDIFVIQINRILDQLRIDAPEIYPDIKLLKQRGVKLRNDMRKLLTRER
jgi:hypothetical protein